MKRSLVCFLVALALACLTFMPSASAEIMSAESFQAMTPYPVPELVDSGSTVRKHPVIQWGTDGDGTVTYASQTNQASFASTCTQPTVVMTVMDGADTGNTGFEVVLKSSTYTGFTYEVRQNANGTVTDVTTGEAVNWVAFGWN